MFKKSQKINVSQTKEIITERQAKILAAIVREYADNAEPVGSEEINAKYNFNVSPATIRNEMSALEKMGYIEQPHTSAGRVPTDFGYRYFVNELMKRFEISLKEQNALKQQLLQLQNQNQETGRNIAKLLAQRTDQAAFALLPEETSVAGFANIISNPNADQETIAEVAQFIDDIDQHAQRMLGNFLASRPAALIGSEHHLPQISNYSMVVSEVHFANGKKGIIGIVGPKSMRYDKNISMVEYIAKLLSGGLLVTLLLIKF